MNETEASEQVKEAEERLRLRAHVSSLQIQVAQVWESHMRLRKDFDTLLAHIGLEVADVPAQRVVRKIDTRDFERG